MNGTHPPPNAQFNRSFVALAMALSFVMGIAGHRLWERPSVDKIGRSIENTVTPQKTIGGATQGAGHVTTQAGTEDAASKGIGSEAVRKVKRQGGTFSGVVNATGIIPETTLPPEPVAILPTLPGQTGWDGIAVQDRGGLPPLTSAHFVYAPATGLTVAWINKAEVLKVGVASWRSADDGLHGAIRIVRVVEGVEEPIKTDADVFYPFSEVANIAPFPKGSYGVGTWFDTSSGHVRILFSTARQWSRTLSTEAVIVPGSGYGVVVRKTFGSQQ